MARRDNSLQHEIIHRLDRIEKALFGNGNSILERLTRLETTIASMREGEEQRWQNAVRRIMQEQLEQQRSSSRWQVIGVWIALISLALYVILSALLKA